MPYNFDIFHALSYSTILFYSISYTTPHYTAPQDTTLHHTTLYFNVLHHTVPYYSLSHYSISYQTSTYCTPLDPNILDISSELRTCVGVSRLRIPRGRSSSSTAAHTLQRKSVSLIDSERELKRLGAACFFWVQKHGRAL